MAEAEAKSARGTGKGKVTRAFTEAKRLMTEDADPGKVEDQLEKIKEEFERFVKLCDAYIGVLEDEAAIDTAVTYLETENDSYCDRLQRVIDWIDSRKNPKPVVDSVKVKVESDAAVATAVASQAAQSNELMTKQLIAAVNLPKFELEPYSGDPLMFFTFMNAFDESVGKLECSAGTKLARLLTYTTGEAHVAIKSTPLLGGDRGYEKARNILLTRFGDPNIIVQAVMMKLREGSAVRTSKDLRVLYDDLNSGSVIVTQANRMSDIESQVFIASVANRLPLYLKNKWRKIAIECKARNSRYPSFAELLKFVETESMSASDPVYGENGLVNFRRTETSSRPATGTRSYATEAQPKKETENSMMVGAKERVQYCEFCKATGSHRITRCDSFRGLTPQQKLDFCRSNNLCENCMFKHSVKDCRFASNCRLCDGNESVCKHSYFLHDALVKGKVANLVQAKADLVVNALAGSSGVCVPMVRVRVNNAVDCAAMLDTGSTATFMSRSLAAELGVCGSPIVYDLSTLTGDRVQQQSGLVSTLFVQGHGQASSIQLHNVHIIDRIPGSGCMLDCNKYSHLQGVDALACSKSIGLLIGQDNSECLLPLECKVGRVDEPYAVRTVLGWSFHGGERAVVGDSCGLVIGGVVGRKEVAHVATVRRVGVGTEGAADCENRHEGAEGRGGLDSVGVDRVLVQQVNDRFSLSGGLPGGFRWDSSEVFVGWGRG